MRLLAMTVMVAVIGVLVLFYTQRSTTPDDISQPVPETQMLEPVAKPHNARVNKSDSENTVSPFDVVAESTDLTLGQESNLSDKQKNSRVESDIERSQAEPIAVPQSYSINDAAKYFVPKDQRGPGNLGGPPPLNFPDGPNDLNRTESFTGDTNALPTEPGE